MVTPEEMVSIVDEYIAQPAAQRDERFTVDHAKACKDMRMPFIMDGVALFPEFPPEEVLDAMYGKAY
jgi:hypothetical protein